MRESSEGVDVREDWSVDVKDEERGYGGVHAGNRGERDKSARVDHYSGVVTEESMWSHMGKKTGLTRGEQRGANEAQAVCIDGQDEKGGAKID